MAEIRVRARAVASAGLLAIAMAVGTSAAGASLPASGKVDVKFSETVHGTMNAAITPPRCSGSSTRARLITLDGKVGSDEYVLTVHVLGPQVSGDFPIGVASQNVAAATVQKVGTKASPSTSLFVAQSGTVTTKSATSGSIDAELLSPGRNPQPLHARGTWACSARPAKSKKKKS